MGELHDAMLAVVHASIDSIVDPAEQVRAGAAVSRWDVPEADRAALIAYGLPRGPLLVPAPQQEERPVLVSTGAGEREARLVRAGERLYRLGVHGSDHDASRTLRAGAVAGSGRVLAVRERPLTTADLHPQLQPYHPDLDNPAVHYFNASLRAFVEIAWRWHAAVKVIRAHPEPIVSGDPEPVLRYHAELGESCSAFLAAMAEIDPTIADEGLDPLWPETILGD